MENKQDETQNRLSEVIKNNHKPLKQISEETGIPYPTLANYSQGKRSPRSTETWDKLANCLKVSTAFLMGVDETTKEDLNSEKLINQIKKLSKTDKLLAEVLIKLLIIKDEAKVGELENKLSLINGILDLKTK